MTASRPRQLRRPQRGLGRLEWPGELGVEWQLPHGELFRLLGRTGFDVVDLVELYAPDGAIDHPHYVGFSAEWARKWPAEEIWVAKKRRRPGRSRWPRPRRSAAPFSSSSASRSLRSHPRTWSTIRPTQIRSTLVRDHAEGKARSVHAEGSVTLGVDTTVHLDGRLYGKAADRDDARAMLGELAGRTHRVLSGLCLLGDGFAAVEHATTDVTFRALPAAEIDAYLDSEEWDGRAGSYAIQGLGARLVARIDGDYLNVVGLPAALLIDTLAAHAPKLLQIQHARLLPHELAQCPHRIRRS